MNKKIRGTIQFSSKDFAKDFKQTLLGPKLDKKYTGDYGNYFDDLKNYISKKTSKKKKGGRRKTKHNLKMVRKFRRTRKKRSRVTQGGSGTIEECNELKSKINYLKDYKNEFTNNISEARTNYKKLKKELEEAKVSANNYYNTKMKGGGGYNPNAVSNEYHKLLNKVEEIENAIKKLREEERNKINEIEYLQYSSDNDILNLLENEEDTKIYDDQIKQYENNFKRFDCENVLKKGGKKSRRKRRKSKKRKTRKRKKRTRRRKRKKR